MKNNDSEVILPSNRKFGYFFGIIWLVLCIYFFLKDIFIISLFFFFISNLFIFVGTLKPKALLPLNKLWMRFGLLLSKFINPLIIGMIFFLIISPIAVLARLTGRDELKLKKSINKTFWTDKETSLNDEESFRKQF